MNQTTEIKVAIREKKGRQAVTKLRTKGEIPAIVYGHNFEPTMLCIEKAEINKIFKRGSSGAGDYMLYKLASPNNAAVHEKMVIIKDIQKNPVTNAILHLDFFAVQMDEEITAPVNIRITGKSAGVKLGGILRQAMREVEVKGLPANIPPHLDIDVTDLDIGDSLHVSDLVTPDTIHILDDSSATLLSILPPTVHKEEEEGEGEEAEAAEGEAAPEDEKTAETEAK